MKNTLINQLQQALPVGMTLPKELLLLYQWIEEHKLYIDNKFGDRVGFLYPLDKLNENESAYEREGGTWVEFGVGHPDHLKYWFNGNEDEQIKAQLCPFVQTGGEGSQAAFWLNDSGELKIVHLGSGSGSTLVCVLADNFVDFLRLIAIGYDEICWDENFPFPPNHNPDELIIQPNLKFQEWVKHTFDVDIPKTALEIVKHPSNMGDEHSEDEFYNWCEQFIN